MLRGKRSVAVFVVAALGVAALGVAALGLAGCAGGTSGTSTSRAQAAKVGAVDGTGTKPVTLTKEAADRLVIQTVELKESSVPPRVPGGPNVVRKIIPYSALLYDADGKTWAFTSPGPLTFVRRLIVVDYVMGDLVMLSDGPPPGTAVVTTGAAELYGTELGVGK